MSLKSLSIILFICALCLFTGTGCQKDPGHRQEEELLLQAQALIEEKSYPQAIGLLSEIEDNKIAAGQLEQLYYVIAGDYIENLQMGVAAIDRNGHVCIAANANCFQDQETALRAVEEWKDIRRLSGHLWGLDALDKDGGFHTVRGTSVSDDYSERNRQIAELEPLKLLFSCNYDFTAQTMDGTVYAYSRFTDYLQRESVKQQMTLWTDVKDIVSGPNMTAVLQGDGTVDFVCENPGYDSEYSDLREWEDIVVIDGLGATGCVAGLKSDGTVVVSNHGTGNEVNFYEAREWSDIIAISMGGDSLLGLKRDGTVVAVGNLSEEQKSVLEWTDIVAVAAGQNVHVGLTADGSIVTAGELPGSLGFPDTENMKDLYIPVVSTDTVYTNHSSK